MSVLTLSSPLLEQTSHPPTRNLVARPLQTAILITPFGLSNDTDADADDDDADGDDDTRDDKRDDEDEDDDDDDAEEDEDEDEDDDDDKREKNDDDDDDDARGRSHVPRMVLFVRGCASGTRAAVVE